MDIFWARIRQEGKALEANSRRKYEISAFQNIVSSIVLH